MGAISCYSSRGVHKVWRKYSRVIYTENKVVSLNKCVQYKYDIYDYFDLFFCYRNNIVMNYSYLSNPL